MVIVECYMHSVLLVLSDWVMKKNAHSFHLENFSALCLEFFILLIPWYRYPDFHKNSLMEAWGFLLVSSRLYQTNTILPNFRINQIFYLFPDSLKSSLHGSPALTIILIQNWQRENSRFLASIPWFSQISLSIPWWIMVIIYWLFQVSDTMPYPKLITDFQGWSTLNRHFDFIFFLQNCLAMIDPILQECCSFSRNMDL